MKTKKLDVPLKLKDDYSFDVLFPESDFICRVSPKRELTAEKVLIDIAENREFFDSFFASHGGVYFTGFNFTRPEFKKFSDTICTAENLSYVGGVNPRPVYDDGLSLTTELPKPASLPLHHEMAYLNHGWPMKIMFYCEIAPATGGETPIASTRDFMKKISPRILESFNKKGLQYRRNYTDMPGFSVPWPQVFKTSDKSELAKICKSLDYEIEWVGENLRTISYGQAVSQHPVTGESCWRNQALLWFYDDKFPRRPSVIFRCLQPGVPPELHEKSLNIPAEKFPVDALFAHGERIPFEDMEAVNEALESIKKTFTWKVGDFIALDNMLSFHARHPYTGDRKVLTVLKEKHTMPSRKRKAG